MKEVALRLIQFVDDNPELALIVFMMLIAVLLVVFQK